jgi:hypothetical protein
LAYLLLICIVFLLTAVSSVAQSPPQYLYGSTASELGGFSKVANGGLSPLAGTAFSDPQFHGGMMAIDGKGQFLFLIDHIGGGVWMFQIHNDGSLTRAPGAPFFAPANGGVGPAPSAPVSLATELSGQFLYVGYQSGYAPGDGAIVEFQISVVDPANPQLVPAPLQTTSFLHGASPLQMLADSKGAHLYVTLKGAAVGGTNVYAIDSTSGAFTSVGTAGGGNPNERSMALDPGGQFFFDDWGSNVGFIESAAIASGGTTTALNAPIILGSGNIPSAMLVDGLGKFLYVDVPTAPGTYVYPIEPTGNLATPPVGPISAFLFQTGTAVADPQAPYIYSLQPDGLHSFVVDAGTGAVSDAVGSPFSLAPGSGIGGLAISGTSGQAVTGAVAQLFPPSQDFGMVFVGQTGVANPAPTLTNAGNVALNLTGVSITGINAGDFTATPVCALPAFLPVGTGSNATCSINVTFAPTGIGARHAILTTTTDTAGTQSTILTGIGTGGQAGATIAPPSLTFPSTQQGVGSAGQVVTLTSSGAAALHISSVTMTGANPGDFAMTSTCSGAIAANASCTVTVTFLPIASGSRNASISIADDAPDSPQIVPIMGTGAGTQTGKPAVTLAPSTVSFASIAQGSTSPAQSITVTNSGTASLHISSVQIGGANPSDFGMNNGCAPSAYAVSASCAIALTFTPSAAGTRSATLTVTDDAANSPQIVQVGGTGMGAGAGVPSVTLSSAAVSFAAIALGTTSAQQNITVTSSGNAPLHFSSVKLGGTNAADFALSNGCTAAAYAVNTACTVGLTFTPSAAGMRTATLTIADDAPNSPQIVTVSGNANPLFSVSPVAGGSLSATVTAGQLATFNLQLTAGFSGTVSFTCAGAPASATCSVPTTITVINGVPMPLIVTVATTGSSAAMASWGRSPIDVPVGAPRWPSLILFVYLLAGWSFCVVAARSFDRNKLRGPRPRLNYGAVLAVCTALAVCTVAGCGGASSVAQSAPSTQVVPTPTGTSMIIVTPTAKLAGGTPVTGIAPLQLTLTVN